MLEFLDADSMTVVGKVGNYVIGHTILNPHMAVGLGVVIGVAILTRTIVF